MAFDMEIFAQLRELADLEFLIFAYALCLSCRNFSDACLRALLVL